MPALLPILRGVTASLALALSRAVRAERARLALSQGELAQRLGVSQSTVSAIEQGTRRVYADELVELCRTFDISLDELLARAEASDRRVLGL
jgi:transcriptional regulator with XRE-family HTH domain